ncbi:DsbC family protein [Cupriavidus basilensis]|uniref:Thiol:disulfide interchange protein n=1 Tax=Cupriavidus basilensis TaxID=68895 RepID=A0A0C4YGZ8_9BURK|nr:DsbC family protein [Cupriavidus basilensis]AJG22228.1 Thiol:disulfide interchange protein DsbC [Cupriavidus basilensis]
MSLANLRLTPRRYAAVAALVAVAALNAMPATAQDDPKTLAVLQALKERYPKTEFSRIRAAEIPGLYEVSMGKNVAYFEASGRYALFGHLYDMNSQVDLTAQREQSLQVINVDMLPVADAIKTVRGKGSRALYVFSDPDCPFCHQLEASLKGLDDVTIYTFLYPLEGLHPDAKKKSAAIWCAKDRAGAWDAWMGAKVLPAPRSCATPVERNLALGAKLGVEGTPTIFAADGRKLVGAASTQRIDAFLSGGQSAAAR